ncbi:MAG TPA: methyltransferase domain-containing protein [Solirubrobacteraceae bacterium]|nr:methyltransferase domain-containing protein [Solirubrobacteraceae bacterium]
MPASTRVSDAPAALERALPLVDPDARPADAEAAAHAGYLDLLGGDEPASTGIAQNLMLTGVVPTVYERWWRPALGRVAKGLLGPGMADEHRIARLLLGLTPGDGVLDVACGPGNFTRRFAHLVGQTGLAVGIDASPTMLERAVRDSPDPFGNLLYVRGNAVELPFRDRSFDAVCCFAALHLFAQPFVALDHMARVLTPGGRVAIFTSCRTRSAPLRTVDGLVGARSGMRMFERDEITTALADRGFVDVRQRISGLTQFVGGRKR